MGSEESGEGKAATYYFEGQQCARCLGWINGKDLETVRKNLEHHLKYTCPRSLTPTERAVPRYADSKPIDLYATTEHTAPRAAHFDSGKRRVDLVPPELIEAVADVLAKGAEKYTEYNWQKGMEWMKLYGSALRHLLAFRKGEDKDPESGLDPIAHAICDLAFLLVYRRTHPELDNRSCPTK